MIIFPNSPICELPSLRDQIEEKEINIYLILLIFHPQ